MNTNYKCILVCAQKYSIAVYVAVAEATGKVLWKKLLNLEVKQVSNLPCVPSPLLRLVMYMRIYTYTPIYEVMYIHTHIEMKDDVFGHHGLTRWWIAAQLLSYLETEKTKSQLYGLAVACEKQDKLQWAFLAI